MRPRAKRIGPIVTLLLWSSSLWSQPETINIQGTLSDASGNPLVGTRAYRIQFFDSAENGGTLGAVINGLVTLSDAGRFSIDFLPPAQVLGASDVFYSLGIDSAAPPDGSVDAVDVFPERVMVNSVLFARMAASAKTANHALSADTAATAMTLSGQLTNPGDQIPLGGGVVLQVASDGTVEFLTGGERFRLAGQKWFDPRNLLDNISPDGTAAGDSQVAINNAGEAVIVWNQRDGANFQIFRNERRNGSWIDPSSLSDNISPDGQSAVGPQVTLNNAGDAVIVWRQSDGSHLQIFRSEYRNGTSTDPADLSDNISLDGQDSYDPQVSINDNGDAVIVWSQSDSSNDQIFRSEYRNGSWIESATLTDNISPDGQTANFPEVAINAGGDALIVWHQSDGAKLQIFRSEYRNGSWTDPSDLSDNISPDGQEATFPQLALNDNGEAVIVWPQSDGANSQIFRSEYRNGSWSDPADLMDNISPDGQDASHPRVALNNSGEAVIVWHQSDGTNTQIFRSEYRNGVWTDPADLSDTISPDGQIASEPQVAMNNNGDAVVVWEQSDGSNRQIFRSEYRDGMWRDPLNLSDNISPNGEIAFSPQVAINDNGDAVIVWSQSDGSFSQIFRSEFRFGF